MNKRLQIILGFMLLGLAIWLQVTPVGFVRHVLDRLDNIFYDLQVRTNLLAQKNKLNSPVVIIDIDEKSLQREGRWPWPRSKLAQLVNVLHDSGVVVVVFDMVYPEPEINIAEAFWTKSKAINPLAPNIENFIKTMQPYFNNDKVFAESLAKVDVVIGFTFSPLNDVKNELPPPVLTLNTPQEKALGFNTFSGVIGNIPIIQNAAKNIGFINAIEDEDGVIRRQPLLMRYKDNVYPMLALMAAQVYLLSPIKLVTASYGNQLRLEGIKFNNYIIPTDDQARVVIPFRGPARTFPFISATDVLHKQFPRNTFLGKIVFVGSTATGDLVSTPAQTYFPGVELQATIADAIIAKTFSYRPAWVSGLEISLTFILGFMLVLICPFLNARALLFLALAVTPALIISNNYFFNETTIIISMVMPILSSTAIILFNIFYNYFFETRKRERIMHIFDQYVPIKHIDKMLSSEGEFGLQGENRSMTVLFADIRNFTSISEPLNASELKELLSAFFTPMTEIIFHHKGTIDKYVGDLIMAFWGAPLADKNHARNAIRAALDMEKAIKKLRPLFTKRNWPEISIGIGINTGLMNVGDMGSKFRRNYTVLGDSVNLASRVESLTKFYGVTVLVTEETQQEQKEFIFRKIDKIKALGKANSNILYEPLCRASEASEELITEVKIHQSGLEFYFNQQWEEAKAIFAKLHQTHPDSQLYKIYLKRIEQYQQAPPPQPWDGAYVHMSK